MSYSQLDRRSFLGGSLATGLLASSAVAADSRKTTVAAVQMRTHVGDLDGNLEAAENWIRYALRRGARWVVLPEFFASGMSYHPDKMLDAAQPVDGAATQMLKRMAKEGNAYLGGTILAQSDADVYNTFVLATPDGRVFTHDKDFPSGFVEHSFYAGGEDDEFVKELEKFGVEPSLPVIPSRKQNVKSGIFPVRDTLSVGAAICWEQLRYRTARRLRNNVDLVMASSAWGALDPDVGLAGVERDDLIRWGKETRKMIHRTPRRLARLVGAPIVHANGVGSGWSNDGRPDKPPMLGRGLGDSQVVDGNGNILARRRYADGEGIVIADLKLGRVTPTRQIPSNAFWTPDFTDGLKESWYTSGSYGRDYYLETARPHRNKE